MQSGTDTGEVRQDGRVDSLLLRLETGSSKAASFFHGVCCSSSRQFQNQNQEAASLGSVLDCNLKDLEELGWKGGLE